MERTTNTLAMMMILENYCCDDSYEGKLTGGELQLKNISTSTEVELLIY